MTPAAVRRIKDPIGRAKAAMNELEAVEALRAEYLALLDEALVEAAAVHPGASCGTVGAPGGSISGSWRRHEP